LLQHCTLVLVNTRSNKYESTEPCQIEHALNPKKRQERRVQDNFFLMANPFKIKKNKKNIEYYTSMIRNWTQFFKPKHWRYLQQTQAWVLQYARSLEFSHRWIILYWNWYFLEAFPRKEDENGCRESGIALSWNRICIVQKNSVAQLAHAIVEAQISPF